MIRSAPLAQPARVAGLALAAVLAACGGDEPDTFDDVVTGKTGAPAAHEVEGFVSGVRNGPPIAGAEVCLVDADDVPCAVTDTTGHYVLRMPVWKKQRELAVHVTAPGYLGFAGMVRASPRFDRKAGEAEGWWQHSIDLFDEGTFAELAREFPHRAAPDRGLVLVDVWYRDSGTPEGAEIAFGPADAKEGRRARVPKTGQILFADVPPGRFELKVEGCTPKADLPSVWRAETRDAVAGLAVPGAITRIRLTCQEDRASAKPRDRVVGDL